MTKIYESPDGGETIYVRNNGENTRTLYSVSSKSLEKENNLKEITLWNEIRQAAKTDETLQKALEQVKLLYYMKKTNGSET